MPTILTATVTAGTNILYVWNFGDGITETGQIVSHIYPEIGTYIASVTATNLINGQAKQTYVVIEEPIEGLTATNSSPTPLGNATSLIATVLAGNEVVYEWKFGDGTTGMGHIVNHVYPNIGLYTATVTATNFINSQTAQTVVTIVEQTISGLTATNNSPTSLGNSTFLTATVAAGSNVSYEWDFGDGTLGNGQVTSHVYLAIGIYMVTVTATNSVSSQTTQTIVTIEEAVGGLMAMNNSPTVIGDLTTLTATVISGTNIEYEWDFGDGTTGSGESLSHVYAAIGVYTATVTAVNPVSSVFTQTLVTIIDEAVTGLTAVNSSPTLIGAPTSLTGTVSTGTNVIYLWDFGDGTTGYGPTASHTYLQIGIYTATLTADNSINSVAAETVVIVVDEAITGLTAFNNGPTPLGNPTLLTTTVVAGSNVSYVWDFGDGTTGNGSTVSHIYLTTGVYTAVVTATNSAGSFVATTTVVILPAQSPPLYFIFLPIGIGP